MDLIVRNAQLRGREREVDVGISAGRICSIEDRIREQADREIDAAGNLVTPTFVDPHTHLDRALVSGSVPPTSPKTPFRARDIAIERKRRYTHEDVVCRASQLVEWAVSHGTTVIRTHVDVDPGVGLLGLEAIMEVKEKYADLADIQTVVFPSAGLAQVPQAVNLCREAFRLGADVMGGVPHAEADDENRQRHIDIAFSLAHEFDVDLDMHLDATLNPASRNLVYFARRAIECEFQGRVTAGHTCALSAYDDQFAAEVIDLLLEARMNVITVPTVDLMFQGSGVSRLRPRGITRVDQLLGAGVTVTYGQNNVLDPYSPIFGQADLLEVGMILAFAAQFNTPEEIEMLFDMPTKVSAAVLKVPDYGVRVGAKASLNILEAKTVQEAFRTRCTRLFVLKEGRVIAEGRTYKKIFRRGDAPPL